MVVNGWFETRLIAPRTWAIGDHGCDVIYLVAGDERALLIDTGWGIGDLPGVVASLTDLPLLVVNTHGHPDHTVRSWQFERVHMYEADARMMGGSPVEFAGGDPPDGFAQVIPPPRG